jgi:hypothetical protein
MSAAWALSQTGHRTHHHDASVRARQCGIGAEQRRESLGDDHRAHHIDLDLLAKFVDR